MGRPDVALHEERAHIRSPGVSCPSQDLFQEAPVRFHGTEEFGLLAALHIGAPSVADHPSGKELVVAGVELVFPKPVIVREAVQELRILKDNCSVSGCTTGETWETAVDVG